MPNVFSKPSAIAQHALFYVVTTLAAFIALICLAGVDKSQIIIATVQAAAPTVQNDGSAITLMGETGSPSYSTVYNARLNADQSEVLWAEGSKGLVIATTKPYAYSRRSTTNNNGAFACTWDGKEITNPTTALIFCTKASNPSGNTAISAFLAQTANANGVSSPVIGNSATIGINGMITVVSDFIFLTSDKADGKIYRMNTAGLSTSDPGTTKTATDGSLQFTQGVCGTTNCYFISSTRMLSKFTVGSSSVDPAHVASPGNIDLSSAIGSPINAQQNVLLDSTNNVLFVAGGADVVKIDLTGFTYTSSNKITLTSGSPTQTYIFEPSFTSSNNYFLILTSGTTSKAIFIKTSDMSQSVGVDVSGSTTRSGYIVKGGTNGALVNGIATIQKLTVTDPSGTPSPSGGTPSPGATTTTTAAPGPLSAGSVETFSAVAFLVICSSAALIL